VTTGVESIIGKTGVAREDLAPEGFIVVDGELWWAKAKTPVRKGERVVILGKEGAMLLVERKEG